MSLSLPSELAGGNLEGLFASMGLEARRGERLDEWILREAVYGHPASDRALVESKTLYAPWLRSDRYDLLVLPGQDYAPPMPAVALDEERRRTQERISPNDLTALFYRMQVEIVAARDADLIDTVRQCSEQLAAAHFDDGSAVFANRSVHLVSIDRRLYTRSRLPAIVLRFEQDSSFIDDLREGGGKKFSEHPAFASNEAVAGSGLLIDTYVGPLLACRAPDIWAVHGQRLHGTVLFSLGAAISGAKPMPAELLQLLPRRGPTQWPDRPESTSSKAWAEAIDWWALKLNQLFAHLSSPSSYRDAAGHYLPYVHQNWMMNIEELFNRVTSTMLAWKDSYAARILTFSALDLVSEAFLGGDMSELCNPGRAHRTLLQIKETMPAVVQEALLPNAEAAVEALSTIADGFFIKSYRETDTVDIVKADQSVEHLEPNKATAALLRARRNATHGFGGKTNEERGTRILAHHDGTLPHELVGLPYLYLLKVLCDPQRLHRRIEGQCRRANQG